MLSLAERYTRDGEVIGMEKGVVIGKAELANEARELYEKGIFKSH